MDQRTFFRNLLCQMNPGRASSIFNVNVQVIEVEFLICLNYCFVTYRVLYLMLYCCFVSAIDPVFYQIFGQLPHMGNIFKLTSRLHLHRLR